MSVHIPISVNGNLGIKPDTVFNRNEKLIDPGGINILDGNNIQQE